KPTTAITVKQPGQRGSNQRYVFYFRELNKTRMPPASPAGRRVQFRRRWRRIRRQRFGWRDRRSRSWSRRRRILWHGALVKESLLLQRSAVNLINTNQAAYKIPVLLIRESAIVCRPCKLARRLRMIWIIYQKMIHAGIRR